MMDRDELRMDRMMMDRTELVVSCGENRYLMERPAPEVIPSPAPHEREQRAAAALARLKVRALEDEVLADLITVLGLE